MADGAVRLCLTFCTVFIDRLDDDWMRMALASWLMVDAKLVIDPDESRDPRPRTVPVVRLLAKTFTYATALQILDLNYAQATTTDTSHVYIAYEHTVCHARTVISMY